jgi:hypothetical protein
MRRGIVLLSLLIATVAVPGGRVAAHAALTESTPADGAVVTEPLGEVILTFSEGVEPTAEGFAVSVDGVAVEPAVTTPDGAVWVLRVEPITSGAVVVAYDVVSADGHLITGELAFTVDAPTVATTALAPLASAPPSAAPNTLAPPVTMAPATTAATTPTTSTTVAATTPSTTVADDSDGGGSDTVLWVIVIAGGVALLGLLGWGAARRSRP